MQTRINAYKHTTYRHAGMHPLSLPVFATTSDLILVMALLKDTFVKAKDWVRELSRQVMSEVVTTLCGNKSDLSNLRNVTTKVRACGLSG